MGWIFSIFLLLGIWGMVSFIYMIGKAFGGVKGNKFMLFPMVVLAKLLGK